MLAELVYRCSVELDFIPGSDVELICPKVELMGRFVIIVESVFFVLRGEVDHTRESDIGLGCVGRPIDGVALGGLNVMEPFIDVTNRTWKTVVLLHRLSK